MTKPIVDASNLDGNVFVVAGAVRQALRKAGDFAGADRVMELMTTSGSYDVALARFSELVEFRFGTSLQDADMEDDADDYPVDDDDEDEDEYDFDDQAEDE
jgi:hypothetical protein